MQPIEARAILIMSELTVTSFLRKFFADDDPIYLFGFSPKEIPEGLKEIPTRIQTTITELATNRKLQQRLKKINETQGLYFTVNFGGTTKADITRINAVFCEIDDLPIIEQHDLYDMSPFPPSIRVVTKKSVHAYWLLSEEITTEQFCLIQNGLIEYFNSDKALKNQNRVMRLPLFNHISFDQGEYLTKRVGINTLRDARFSFDELSESYPVSPEELLEPTVWAKEYENNDDDWQVLFRDMADRFRGLSGYHVERGDRLASARGICHNGDTNRTLVMNLQTGRIFCRAECTWDEIRRAMNIELPKSKVKRYRIERVVLSEQSSELYQALRGEL